MLPAKAKVQVDASEETGARAKHDWQASLTRVLAEQSPVLRKNAIRAIKEAKVGRASAYVELRCLDHALSLSGIGLSLFVPDSDEVCAPLAADERRDLVAFDGAWPFAVPEGVVGFKSVVTNTTTGSRRYVLEEYDGPRPCIGICLDQGSPGWSAGWFLLQRMHLRGHVAFDVHHRAWNDCLAALADTGLKHLVFDFMLVMNLPHGPWKSAEWFRVIQQSYDRYLAKNNVHDQLFQLLYAGLARDFGEDQCGIVASGSLPPPPRTAGFWPSASVG